MLLPPRAEVGAATVHLSWVLRRDPHSPRQGGQLRKVGHFPTGGTGSGSFEDTANSLVLGGTEGEAAPNNLIEGQITTQLNSRHPDSQR